MTQTRKVLRLNFERNSIEVPYDSELHRFFEQVKPESASAEDIHVMFAYFQIYWPFKTMVVNEKPVNFPQLYKGLYVREDRGKKS
jgi:hypothetical protein